MMVFLLDDRFGFIGVRLCVFKALKFILPLPNKFQERLLCFECGVGQRVHRSAYEPSRHDKTCVA
jgi:hypothetical protein